jgi:hypothetical protein
MTIGDHLVSVAEAGIAIARGRSSDEDMLRLLIVLLDLEDSLDKGRAVVHSSGFERLPEINEKMNVLRKEIGDLIASLPAAEVKECMEARGESLKRQFAVQ